MAKRSERAPNSRAGEQGACFWNVEPTDDYAADCERGAVLANELLAQVEPTKNLFLLGWVLQNMIAHGRFGGLEVGFAHEIALWASLGKYAAKRPDAA